MDAEPPPRAALAAFVDPLAAPLAAGRGDASCCSACSSPRRERNPLEVYQLMAIGAFGSWFSWQNTLLRASPLLLTALCTALPAQMGLVIIGGEGAFVLGGLAAMAAGLPLADHGAPAIVVQVVMAIAGMAAGGALIALAGALRHWRGVNETISSLLLSSIAIAVMNQVVEGPMRDPASLNKPSTRPLPDADLIGNLPGMDVHWGLAIGLIACVLAWLLMRRTTFGFAARIVGGNARAARMAGLPVGRMTVIVTALAGAARGPRRHDRGRRGAGRRQRQHRRRLRPFRHSRRLPRAPASARRHAGRDPARRHRRQRRPVAAPPRSAGRRRAGAARHPVRRAARRRGPAAAAALGKRGSSR